MHEPTLDSCGPPSCSNGGAYNHRLSTGDPCPEQVQALAVTSACVQGPPGLHDGVRLLCGLVHNTQGLANPQLQATGVFPGAIKGQTRRPAERLHIMAGGQHSQRHASTGMGVQQEGCKVPSRARNRNHRRLDNLVHRRMRGGRSGP